MYTAFFQEELPINHEPSLNHWAKLRANEGIANSDYSDWDHAYEAEWMYLDAEYNYDYEYRETV